MQYSYNDGLCHGGRTPRLWVVQRGKVYLFKGETVSGIVAVTSTSYEKNGKWSNTTYQLELVDGAVPCCMLAPMHGQVWPENERIAAYRRFMQGFGVNLSFDAFDAALLRDYPNSHARMIEGEKALESLDASGDTELAEISTSKSCGRNPHDDVRIVALNAQVWVIAHEAPVGTEIPGVCKLVDVKHQPGCRGGTTTLIFAVSKDVKIELEWYHKDGTAHQWALGRGGNGLPNSVVPVKNETAVEVDPVVSDGEKAAGLQQLLAKFGRK